MSIQWLETKSSKLSSKVWWRSWRPSVDLDNNRSWKKSNRCIRMWTFSNALTKEWSNNHWICISLTEIFIETLRTLNLEWNQIDDQGTQHLARALQTNQVKRLLFSFLISFNLVWYRHYKHWIFHTVLLENWEQNTSSMHWQIIK